MLFGQNCPKYMSNYWTLVFNVPRAGDGIGGVEKITVAIKMSVAFDLRLLHY